MQVNSIQNNSQPNFQARVSNKFMKAADNYFLKYGNVQKRAIFDDKVDEFLNFGTDKMVVQYKKFVKDGQTRHKLYVRDYESEGQKAFLLTEKDSFRKVVEKFTHINDFEFNSKSKKLF